MNQTSALTTATSEFKLPPLAQFDHSLKYLDPTDQQTVHFTNQSTDLYGDPLDYQWLVDGQLVSQEKDYSTKFPVGDHTVTLQVTDSTITVCPCSSIADSTITSQPDQIYPTKPLLIKYKGMNYAAAPAAPEFTVTPRIIPNQEELDEQLSTIHDELGCNAVSICVGAGYEDNLIQACEIAMQKGFDRIYVLAKYMHFTSDEIAEKLRNLAPRITALREASDKIVWVIGNEFTFCVKGLIPGDTLKEQQIWIEQHHEAYIEAQQINIPQVFSRILPVIRSNYGYPIAYNAEPNEFDLVPWGDPLFESIGWNAYLQPQFGKDESFFTEKFSQLEMFGKPVIVSEFGSSTYAGALTEDFEGQPYDEDEQARNIERYCDMVNSGNTSGTLVSGAFLYIYNEEWDEGWGLYNGLKRKKGFYMYKSYQRVQ